jgi:hypothetical protein
VDLKTNPVHNALVVFNAQAPRRIPLAFLATIYNFATDGLCLGSRQKCAIWEEILISYQVFFFAQDKRIGDDKSMININELLNNCGQ